MFAFPKIPKPISLTSSKAIKKEWHKGKECKKCGSFIDESRCFEKLYIEYGFMPKYSSVCRECGSDYPKDFKKVKKLI